MSLRLDFIEKKYATKACEVWHYTGSNVPSKTVNIGAWESGQFIGAIVFGLGARISLGGFVGLDRWSACELCRVALTKHKAPVSQMLPIALRMLKRQSPGIRVVVSYADATRGHHGGIYQACGWDYVGTVGHGKGYFKIQGKIVHGRSVASLGYKQSVPWLRANIDPLAESVGGQIRHKYAWPFDSEIKGRLNRLAKPYPKRATSDTGDTPILNQIGEGGSTPTVALSAELLSSGG